MNMNRKEFFKTAGRIFLLGGIGAATGYLVVQQKVDVCANTGPCRRCRDFAGCELPPAKEVRDER